MSRTKPIAGILTTIDDARTPPKGRGAARRRARRSFASRMTVEGDLSTDLELQREIRELAQAGEMILLDDLILTSHGIVAVEPEDIPDWAYKNLRVPVGMGTRPGPLRLTAMQRASARLVQSGIKRLTYLKNPRIGFSFFITVIMAYYAVHENEAVMMYDKSAKAARTYCDDKYMRIFRASPKVTGMLPEEKSSGDRQRWFDRTFTNGAKMKFRSFADKIKSDDGMIILVDEAGDSALRSGAKSTGGKTGKGQEGSKIDNIIARGQEHSRFCLIVGGTPTTKGECTVSEEFERSNKAHWFMDFPCCGVRAAFKPDILQVKKDQIHLPHGPGLRYTLDDAGFCDGVWYECGSCSERIEEIHKVPMMETGSWEPTTEGDPGHWGIFSWMIHSQDPNADWPDIANKHKAALDHPDKLQSFTNLYLAKCWTPPTIRTIEIQELVDRAIDYEGFDVPVWVEFLFAGIDSQEGEAGRDDRPMRMEIVIYGVGANMRRAIVARFIVAWQDWRDPVSGETVRVPVAPFSHAAMEQVWAILDKDFVRPDGVLLRVLRTCCDVNWNMIEGTAFCNHPGSRDRKIVPIRGAREGRGSLPPIPPTRDKGFVYEKTGVLVRELGTQNIKTYFHSCLQTPSEAPQSWTFPKGLPVEFYKSLLAEHQVETLSGQMVWRSKNKRQETGEVWDCLVYAYAAELMEREWTVYGRDVIKPTIKIQVAAIEDAMSAEVDRVRKAKKAADPRPEPTPEAVASTSAPASETVEEKPAAEALQETVFTILRDYETPPAPTRRAGTDGKDAAKPASRFVVLGQDDSA